LALVPTFATVFGLNLLGLGTNKAKGIIERIRRTKNPAKTIERIKTAADKAGIEFKKLKAGDPNEVKKMSRVVEDITKTERGRAEAERIKPKERISKEMSPKKLRERTELTKGAAEFLSTKPLKEYLAEKKYKETPKEKTLKEDASKGLERTNRDIAESKRTIKELNDVLEAGIKNKDQRKAVEISKQNLEKRLSELETIRKDLEYQKKYGRKPFSKKEAQEAALRHVEELKEAAKNPEGTNAKEWERKFDRDQKYIDRQIEILKSGKDPIAPYKDRFLKVHETYNEIYRNALKDIQSAIEIN